MVLPELLREIKGRGVTLSIVEDRLRYRPASALTPELVEGLREHKAEILERLEAGNPATVAELEVSPRRGDGVTKSAGEAPREPLLNSPVIESTGEVLGLVRAHFGEIAPEHRMDAPYPPPEGSGDPLVHRHTAKARFFRDVRRRDRERRTREGLPPYIRIVDGGGDAA